jgi:hypothetical protein
VYASRGRLPKFEGLQVEMWIGKNQGRRVGDDCHNSTYLGSHPTKTKYFPGLTRSNCNINFVPGFVYENISYNSFHHLYNCS